MQETWAEMDICGFDRNPVPSHVFDSEAPSTAQTIASVQLRYTQWSTGSINLNDKKLVHVVACHLAMEIVNASWAPKY